MSRETELLVVGAGPGGYPAAIRGAQKGLDVLAVEKQNLGGVCLNWGCIPSKGLIHAAKRVEEIREAEEMGIHVDGIEVDLEEMQDWKEGVVDQLTTGIGQLFKANGVEHLQGEATFTGPNTAEVDTGGGVETVTFENAVIATGSRPLEIPGFDFDDPDILDSKAALDLDHVPDEFVVIGGGFIGLEIGNVMATLGSDVTVVEMMDQILPGQDPEVVGVVRQSLEEKGVDVLTEAKAKGVDRDAGRLHVGVETDDGVTPLPADKVLVAVGRQPNVEGIGLDAAGIDLDGDTGRIPTDDRMRTSNDDVFAVGDVTDGPMLAHKATKEGIVAAEVAAGEPAAQDARALPWAVFTDPEVATVGLTEDEAEEEGYDVNVGKFPYQASGRAVSTNETEGFVKVVSDAESDLVLGVHIVGAEASNLIGEAALGIEMGAFTDDLALTIHTHPTLSEALMEAAESVHGEAIHAVNR